MNLIEYQCSDNHQEQVIRCDDYYHHVAIYVVWSWIRFLNSSLSFRDFEYILLLYNHQLVYFGY